MPCLGGPTGLSRGSDQECHLRPLKRPLQPPRHRACPGPWACRHHTGSLGRFKTPQPWRHRQDPVTALLPGLDHRHGPPRKEEGAKRHRQRAAGAMLPWHDPTPSFDMHLLKRSSPDAPRVTLEKPARLQRGPHLGQCLCLLSKTLSRTRKQRSTPLTKRAPAPLRIPLPRAVRAPTNRLWPL